LSISSPLTRGTARRAGIGAALVGLLSGTLALGLGAPAEATSAGVVIAEVYGGGTNTGAANTYGNDFIELENRGTVPVNLDGWSVQYHSATGTGAFAVHPLTGTIPAGRRYLLQEGTFTTGTQFTPDETGTLNMAAGSGVVALVQNTTPFPTFGTTTGVSVAGSTANGLVDLVGYGNTANTYETARTGTALSSTLSTNRKATADTDNNSLDFQNAAPTPTACLCAPFKAALVSDKTFTVGQAITPFNLTASGGASPYTWTATGLPSGLSLSSAGAVTGTPDAVGSYEVTATASDSSSPKNTSDTSFTIDVDPAPELKTIAEVQGTGAASELVGKRVLVRGVVTGSYPNGTGNFAGFYLQTGGEEGVDYDTPGASDGIFVYIGSKAAPAVGASVEVTGTVEERFSSTQISAPGSSDTIATLSTPLPAVVPGDTIPGTDCALPGTDCLTGAALEALRESHEGEAFLPTGDYTVTDSYDGTPFVQDSSRGFQMQGEIGLAANSAQPLMIPTETIDQSDTSGIAALRAWNDAHGVLLDDGADIDYSSNSFEDTPFPWLTPGNPVRVGAAVEFKRPVILEFRRDFWRAQPETKVAGGTTGADRVAFENTRTNAPEDVLGSTGDLKIATFNMLNYFNTLGEAWAGSDGNSTGSDSSAFSLTNPRRCSYYTDRGPVGGGSTPPAARLTNNTCLQDAIDPLTGLRVSLPGPRGAANQDNFLRQERKELEAINAIDADVMSLEEVENSIKLYDAAIDGPDGADKDRDDALKHLVLQLNAHWASAHPAYAGDRWAYVASPRPEALPTVTEQDAIRSAFIYNPSKVETVGRSQVLVNSAPFRNAREPLAQAFKPLGGGRADAFVVIVNHFKSKGGPTAPATVNGDNLDFGDGAGFYNGDRKRQAAALVAFADQVSSDKDIEPVFFTGDFNSYSAEDPVQVIEAAGFTNLKPSNGETTYSYGGLAGSLDHVFANAEALAMVTGEDVWSINAGESVYYEYSRYNANATDLYAVNPFRSSDHNPEIIGIDTGDNVPDPDVDTVQVLATNDFHGRLLDDPGSAAAGAASMAGAVKQLRADNEDTIFAAAGDLIGASTFESFIQNDEPTIDALNEAGLEVSSVGNHEFDKGYDDLLTRVMPRTTWEYIGANVEFKDTEDGHVAGDPALPETWCEALPNGRVVGFVGAVTEDLPTLVSASAIQDVVVTDIVDAVNEHADELKGPDGCGADGPADLVVELVHEGAATTAYSSVTDDSTFGQIVAGADENVDAIVSGHTHLAYNHKVPVQEWIVEGRAVTKRPVVSAGQYGANLNRLQFEFAPGGGELVNIRQTVLQLKDYDADPATQQIVDAAVAFANVKGNEVLGDIEDRFLRARRTGDDGQIVESRGGESTLGNQIAEMQRWKTGADIGFMNPGGLRADILGLDGTPRQVTYRQAANAQPFANTLVTMDLTGEQIKTLLEQQWQRDADGNIPSRPFLRLGTSAGFTSTFDASRPEGSRITGMWLDGDPIDPAATFRVSATSFLAGAGDNFWAFRDGADVQDTGKTDLEAVVDYLHEFAEHDVDAPLPVDYAQHQVGIAFPGAAPAAYEPGDTLAFDASSLAMTGVDDDQDAQVQLLLGNDVLGTFAVDNAFGVELFDNVGRASVSVTVPAGVEDGTTAFTLRGVTTGTEVTVPVATSDGLPDATVSGDDTTVAYGEPGTVHVTVTPSGATGEVTLREGDTVLGTGTLAGGTTDITVAGGALEVGDHDLVLDYPGDAGHTGDLGQVRVTVTQADSTTSATVTPQVVVRQGITTVQATVGATGYTPTGLVEVHVDGVLATTRVLTDGVATVELEPFQTTGTRSVSVRYLGDDHTRPSEAEAGTVTVVRATPNLVISTNPERVTTKVKQVQLTTALSAPGQTVTGQVRIAWKKKTATQTLSGGSTTFSLGGYDEAGEYAVQVTYLGSDLAEPVTRTYTVVVHHK